MALAFHALMMARTISAVESAEILSTAQAVAIRDAFALPGGGVAAMLGRAVATTEAADRIGAAFQAGAVGIGAEAVYAALASRARISATEFADGIRSTVQPIAGRSCALAF